MDSQDRTGRARRIGGAPLRALAPRFVSAANAERPSRAERVVEAVSMAQSRLDRILRLARSGKRFTPAEILAMQAHVYRASQELDLAGQVVAEGPQGHCHG
jgi:hypothetical protein